jgi:DNA invertase Pin-like site-specific DNA recombinase
VAETLLHQPSISAGRDHRSRAYRIDLHLHQQGLDTTTPSGKAMFGMLGVFAEFERAMIQERVKAGMARAKAEGKQVGRPKIATEVEQSIREALQAGRGIISTAKTHGVGVSAVQRVKEQLASEHP